LATEWVKGKTLDQAGALKNTDIAKELCLPPVKLHCSSEFVDITCILFLLTSSCHFSARRRCHQSSPGRLQEKAGAQRIKRFLSHSVQQIFSISLTSVSGIDKNKTHLMILECNLSCYLETR
jgi:NifU-like N terminal domain